MRQGIPKPGTSPGLYSIVLSRSARVAAVAAFGLACLASGFAGLFAPFHCLASETELSRGYIKLVDGAGAEILDTAIEVEPGDEFYSPAGFRYHVVKVTGGEAVCKRKNGLPDGVVYRPDEIGSKRSIGVYHTHSFEGFKGGVSRNDWNGGGVMGLGAAVGMGLGSSDFRCIHSYTRHTANYHSSKNTARALLAKGCVALLDIHRDTAPAPVISLSPASERASSILVVVGRSNADYVKNLGFALSLKGVADVTVPGLVRGILVTGGVFNQDLNPRSLTLLVGDSLHELAWAQRGLATFAGLLPRIISEKAAAGDPYRSPADPGPPAAAGKSGELWSDGSSTYVGDTFGYLRWALSGFIALVAVVGGYALFQELGAARWPQALRRLTEGFSNGMRRLTRRAAPYGNTAAAFLGRLGRRRKPGGDDGSEG